MIRHLVLPIVALSALLFFLIIGFVLSLVAHLWPLALLALVLIIGQSYSRTRRVKVMPDGAVIRGYIEHDEESKDA